MRGRILHKSHNGKYSIQYDVDLPEYNDLDPVDASMVRRIKPSVTLIDGMFELHTIFRWKTQSMSKMDGYTLNMEALYIYNQFIRAINI
mmetsp:Transcript_2206/g.3086  ORF Transcript_2206/g.3086 Transcript_2206/m.3086 type:complete len:89 (+) Transcript_2206:291-557(+)